MEGAARSLNSRVGWNYEPSSNAHDSPWGLRVCLAPMLEGFIINVFGTGTLTSLEDRTLLDVLSDGQQLSGPSRLSQGQTSDLQWVIWTNNSHLPSAGEVG